MEKPRNQSLTCQGYPNVQNCLNKPGFHMMATIAVIAEKNISSAIQYGNHSPAIAATTIASDCCRCDRLRVVSYDRY